MFNRPLREEITDATRTVVATSSPSAAPTALAASPRIRLSSATPSAPWSSWLPFVTSLMLLSTRSTPCPSSTSRSTTASLALSTPTLFAFAPAWAVATVLLLLASASRMARRLPPLRLPSPCKE